jgi:predicted nucleic acid-binding protein
MKSEQYRQAERWISSRKSSLRTLDGLHLACCLYQGAEMITCDAPLHRAAETFDLQSRLVDAEISRKH